MNFYKEMALTNLLLKVIIKKIYNLSDAQYKKVIKKFEEEGEEVAQEYFLNLENRREYLKQLKEYE